MSDSLIFQQNSSLITLNSIEKYLYSLLNDEKDSIINISSVGSLLPKQIANKYKTERYNHFVTNGGRGQSVADEIKEVEDFFEIFMSLNEHQFCIAVYTIKKTPLRIVFDLPKGYPNTSPIAYCDFSPFQVYPHYKSRRDQISSLEFTYWSEFKKSLKDFVFDSILWINKVEYRSMFNIWLGRSMTTTETL